MTAKLVLFAAFVLSMLLMACNYGRKKRKIIFLGDSITKQGTKRNGYITHINGILKENNLEEKYELIASGIDGNKVSDVHERLKDDVLAEGPDVVVIFIGLNDVWHKELGKGTDAQRFAMLYEEIISQLQEARINMIVCTPTVIGEKKNGDHVLDDDLNKYSQIIRDIAQKNNVPVIDLRKDFLEYNLVHNPENAQAGILTEDGVHLNDMGNEFVAKKIWEAIATLAIDQPLQQR